MIPNEEKRHFEAKWMLELLKVKEALERTDERLAILEDYLRIPRPRTEGDRLISWRTNLDYTPEEAARLFNVPVETYASWEGGDLISNPVYLNLIQTVLTMDSPPVNEGDIWESGATW